MQNNNLTVLKKKDSSSSMICIRFSRISIFYICIFHKFYKIKSNQIVFRFISCFSELLLISMLSSKIGIRKNEIVLLDQNYFISSYFFILIWFYRLKINEMICVLFYRIVKKILILILMTEPNSKIAFDCIALISK